MGKYVVTKPLLNIRNQPKIADNTWVGTLSRGAVVDLDDHTIPGDLPAGTTDNSWRTDTFNRVLANAGVAPQDSFAARTAQFLADGSSAPFVDATTPEDQNKWRISWGHVDLGIWKIWKDFNTKGEGVKVVVIDDGAFSTDNDLKGRIGDGSQSLVDTDTRILDGSNPTHGTACAGLVAANGANCNAVFGVAPACDLVVIKAGANDRYLADDVSNAIFTAIQLGADIISISVTFPASDTTLAGWINQCETKNILVCCSSGNDADTAFKYPASDPFSFSVGAYLIDANGQRQFNAATTFNNRVDFLAPGNQLLTTSQTAARTLFDATSAAAAFTAGMFALVKSSLKGKTIKPSDIRTALAAGGSKDTISGQYGVLNLYNLMQLLKNTK